MPKNLINHDLMPRMKQLDEHDDHWNNDDMNVKKGKLTAILLLILVIFGAVAYSYVDAANALVSCMSLVDENGEE